MIDIQGIAAVAGAAFVEWLELFAAPLKKLDMLWIIVPIWSVWIFSEFFQEKKGTSFGNAITNGAVMLFVGIDWARYIARQISEGNAVWGVESGTEIAISAFIIVTSLAIIILGIRGKAVVKLIGRVRESTYLLLMFTPVIYGVIEFNFRTLAVILAFFPVFYIVVEILDRVLPNPQTFDLEEEKVLDKELALGEKESAAPGDFGRDAFGAAGIQRGFPQRQQPMRQQRGRRL